MEYENSFFPLRDENVYVSFKRYQGDCIYKGNYIGRTECKVIMRWSEYYNPTLDSEPSQHLRNNLNHSFN